jgi:hypothetical protein
VEQPVPDAADEQAADRGAVGDADRDEPRLPARARRCSPSAGESPATASLRTSSSRSPWSTSSASARRAAAISASAAAEAPTAKRCGTVWWTAAAITSSPAVAASAFAKRSAAPAAGLPS